MTSSKLKWWYTIHPNTSWFGSFARSFFSPDIRLWPEDTDGEPQYYGWGSHHLSDAVSPNDLSDRTAALKALFDGAMYLAYGPDYHPPRLTGLSDESGGSSGYLSGLQHEPDVRAEPFSITHLASQSEKHRNPLNNRVASLLFLARFDQVTKDLLKFVGVQGLTYVSLYAFTDWMKSEGWDDKRIATEASWSNGKLRDFKGTANNPAYLGPFCRHGGTSVPFQRAIPLGDAQEPLRKAIMAFLSERGQTFDLQSRGQAIVRP